LRPTFEDKNLGSRAFSLVMTKSKPKLQRSLMG